MAGGRVLSVTQNYFLNFIGKCWNFQQRNISNQRMVLELVGNVSKPKKPKSPFLMFAMDRKDEIAAQFPKKKMKDIMRVLGDHWSKLSMNEKQKYINMYEEEKKKYFDKIKTYEDSVTKLGKNKLIQAISDFKNSDIPRATTIIKNILKKSLNRPKAPTAPYIRYLIQNKGQILNSKGLAESWKNLSDEEKNKYKEEYFKEWEKYEKELETWEKKMIKEGLVDIVRLKTLREETNKNV